MSTVLHKRNKLFLPFFYLPNRDYRRSRYKIARGGRAGSKSWEFITELVLRSSREKLRILCCREIQRSIKQSVHKLIKDTIARLGLSNRFIVTDRSIRGVNGSEFFFEGLWNNIDNIKSMEGIDICFVEEGQSISKRSWEVLRPTVFRNKDAEIWVSYNPTYDDDPIHEFANGDHDSCIVFDINYTENPFVSEAIIEEAEEMRRTDMDLYRHIYGGETISNSQAEIFYGKWVVDTFEAPPGTIFYHGLDFGYGPDPTAIVRCFIEDNTLYIDYAHYYYKSDPEDIADRMWEDVPNCDEWRIYADNAYPGDIRFFKKKNYNISGIKKTEIKTGIRWLRSFDKIVVHAELEDFIFECKNYKYKVDPKTEEVTPIILDKHNHGWDALRYALGGLILRGIK